MSIGAEDWYTCTYRTRKHINIQQYKCMYFTIAYSWFQLVIIFQCLPLLKIAKSWYTIYCIGLQIKNDCLNVCSWGNIATLLQGILGHPNVIPSRMLPSNHLYDNILDLATAVKKVDNTIHWINHYLGISIRETNIAQSTGKRLI